MREGRLIDSRSACLTRALMGASLLLWSCTTPPPPPPPPEPVPVATPEPVPDPPPPPPEPPPPPPPDPKHKKAAPPKRLVMTPEMDERLAKPLLSLLEREAQIQQLDKKLDEAIQETVRSKAKLASQESRAEAATNLAEAETALKTLRDSPAGSDKRPELAQANALMRMSAEELKKENYSGTLYATNQVKAILKDVQDRAQGREKLTPVDGEVLLARPLPLKITASGKVYERPAADAVVAWSVERGASPTAVSYKGPWIRVKGEGDRWGWMFYNLIAGP